MTKTTSPVVATQILEALGGSSRVQAMTGAALSYDSESLTLRFSRLVGSGKARFKFLRISLSPSDLYNLEGFKVTRSYDTVQTATIEGVQVANLRETVERLTGLYLSL